MIIKKRYFKVCRVRRHRQAEDKPESTRTTIKISTTAVWALALFSSGFFILCDSFSANWAKVGSRLSLAIVVGLSPTAYLLFGLLASRVNLAVAGSLVNLMIMIGAVLVGIFYFNEHVRPIQWIGICLGLVAALMLSLSVKK